MLLLCASCIFMLFTIVLVGICWLTNFVKEDRTNKMLIFLLSNLVFLSCTIPVIFVEGDANSHLRALQEEFYRWHEQHAPEFSTSVGSTAYNDRVYNLSLAEFDANFADIQNLINRTNAVDRNQLDRQLKYSYDIFMDTLTTFTTNYVWRQFGALNPVNFMEAFYLNLNYIIDITPFKSKEDFEKYIARVLARPLQIDQTIERMQESIRLGTTYHRVSVQTVPGQIDKVITTPPVQNILYKPFNDTLDLLDIPQAAKDDLRNRAVQGLRGVWTALDRLKTFIKDVYLSHTRGTYGVGGLPAGGNYYRACLKWHLSLDTAPSEVHQIGLREVARISALMHSVMERQGFNGTIAEYYAKIKADPQFHKDSPDALLQDYRNLIFNRITPKLPQLFKEIPNNTIQVIPLTFDGPYGMYAPGSEDGSRPGTFYVNLMRPEETNTFSMVSLTLHESVPGHHLQFVFQVHAGLPDFQKNIDFNKYYAVPYHFPFYTAYAEGWALYAEYLGEEMGVYQNDYEMMGRYGDEIFRACRLVVDTGLHYLGWSREQAVEYLSSRTPMPMAEVQIEVDRYITWPGQACAYKIGELKIKQLRQLAADALGTSFDVRDFHSLLLNNGPVPLKVMENIVHDYIVDQGGKIAGCVVG